MDDLISRQAAIERATKEHDFFRGAVTVSDKARRDELLNVMCWLGELPPAQPAPCEDAVSRKAVAGIYTALWETIGTIMDRDEWDDVCKATANELPSVQPAQPERIRGRWIAKEKKNLFRCSKCDAVIYSESEYDRNEFHKFCGRCGAEMREVTT